MRGYRRARRNFATTIDAHINGKGDSLSAASGDFGRDETTHGDDP